MKERQDLWNALKAKPPRPQEALTILKASPQLINDITDEPYQQNVLIAVMFLHAQCFELVQYVATHKSLDLKPVVLSGLYATWVDALITCKSSSVLQLFIDKPEVLESENQLTYEKIRDQYNTAVSAYNRSLKKDPNSADTLKAKTKLDNLTEMKTMILQATLTHALATDNPLWLTRLTDAGEFDDHINGKSVYFWAKQQGKKAIMASLNASPSSSSSAELLHTSETARDEFRQAKKVLDTAQSSAARQHLGVNSTLFNSMGPVVTGLTSIIVNGIKA